MCLDDLKISQHAKERYAERIMEKDNKADVNVFILQNEGKIKNDIRKMIEFGTLLFSGKPTTDIFGRQPVQIYLNGTWVVIVDDKKKNVVTLYSIDLGLGADFNEQYIQKLLEKLTAAKTRHEAVKARIAEEADVYKNIIAENEAVIAENRKVIKSLERQNDNYKEIIDGLQTNATISEKDVRDIVAIMIGKKVF